MTAVRRVDLEVLGGEFVAVFGPNGAGKTTLLRLIASLLSPSSGSILFSGAELDREQVGFVSHQSLLYNDLSGLENLVFFGRLHGLENPRRRASGLLEKMGLGPASEQRVAGYSRGMKQRLTLARALLHEPRLLLLDEPYTGLDQHGSRLLTDVLEGLKEQGRTILLITHNLMEGLRLATRIVIQHRGRIAFDAESKGLTRRELEEHYFRVVDR